MHQELSPGTAEGELEDCSACECMRSWWQSRWGGYEGKRSVDQGREKQRLSVGRDCAGMASHVTFLYQRCVLYASILL